MRERRWCRWRSVAVHGGVRAEVERLLKSLLLGSECYPSTSPTPLLGVQSANADHQIHSYDFPIFPAPTTGSWTLGFEEDFYAFLTLQAALSQDFVVPCAFGSEFLGALDLLPCCLLRIGSGNLCTPQRERERERGSTYLIREQVDLYMFFSISGNPGFPIETNCSSSCDCSPGTPTIPWRIERAPILSGNKWTCTCSSAYQKLGLSYWNHLL